MGFFFFDFFFVCYIHAVHNFVVIFILYLCLLKQVTGSGF